MTTFNGKPVDDLLQSDDFKKSLKDAEPVIQCVNKNFISLNDEDYTTYSKHLTTVLSNLVTQMKSSNVLFNSLYQKEHFAGSYADGLKIEKPTEYDMNLIIKLPVDLSKLEFQPGTPSFIKIKGKNNAFQEAASLSTDILGWVDDEGYLLQTKFRDWMESVLTKAFNTLPKCDSGEGNTRCLIVNEIGVEKKYKVGFKKSGPALTLKVVTPDNCSLDVDLVPAFQFGPPYWPPSVEPLPSSCPKKNWLVIPKPKKLKEGEKLEANDTREWRLSFLDQEREILRGTDTVKPTIKLLKKLRDKNQLQLSSYAIKTVILLEMKKHKTEFWKNRNAYLFLYMLNRLIEYSKQGHIPFYWDERDDLLKLGEKTRENLHGRLSKLLKEIFKSVDSNPFIIAEKLLTKDEMQELREKYKGPNALLSTDGSKDKVSDTPKSKTTVSKTLEPNNEIFSQILMNLSEIRQAQENLPKQFLAEFLKIRELEQKENEGKVGRYHCNCIEKQRDQEERIRELEKLVTLLGREINQLKNGSIDHFSVLQ